MEPEEYISKDNITVSNQQSVEEILKVFSNLSYSHLPVVKQKKLIGNISKEDLLCIEDTSQKLADLEYLYEFFFAKEKDPFLELFSNFAIYNTSILPVVDKKHNYLGYLSLNDLLDGLADTPFLNTEGSILLLEKSTSAFSMSELCQIIESNGTTLLGCFIIGQTDETTKVTLKVKSININELMQSFRRYNYVILTDLTEDSYLESLKKRSEYFIKYLNI